MKKKLPGLFLMLTLLLLGTSVFEARAEEAESYSAQITHVNPRYADVISEDELEAAPPVYYADGAVTYYDSIEEAAADVREQMVDRAATITVGVKHDLWTTDVAHYVFDEAIEHTGVPVEGDYLAFTYGGWNANLSYYTSGTKYHITVTYSMRYYTTAEQEAELNTAVTNLLAELSLSEAEDYDKVCGIYDYMCDNISYDYEGLDEGTSKLIYTAYAALVNKTAVCQGYANLFYRLALELGVDARIISGSAGGPHAWNIVKLGDVYYNVDATWDAGYSYYDYFLQNPEGFSDHIRNSEYDTAEFHAAYPMSELDYSEFLASQGDEFVYNISDNKATLVDYNGMDTNVVIPAATEEGYPVTGIGYSAFMGNTRIESVTIPASVTVIEDGYLDLADWGYVWYGAFSGCTKLTTVIIPENSQLTTIGEWAFYKSGLKNITLPASIRTLEMSCFEQCAALTDLVLPEGLKTIEQNAFFGTGIKALHLPSTVTSLHYTNNTEVLEAYTVAEGNTRYRAYEGVLYDNQSPTPPSYIGWTLISYPKAKPGAAYTVPDYCTHIWGDVMSWGQHPLYLETLYIRDAVGAPGATGGDSLSRIATAKLVPAVTNINYELKNGILLSEDGTVLVQVPFSLEGKLTVPDGVEEINNYVFWYNESLERIILPESISYVGEGSFGFFGRYEEAVIIFTGDAPEFSEDAFWWSGATIYYPAENVTWTADVLDAYGGNLTWISYEGGIPLTSREMVESFVGRLYSILLDREVDDTGLAYWTDVLVDQLDTGATVASNIILGDEFTSKTLTDLEFLNRMYLTVFDRLPDEDGKEYWLGVLAAGEPRTTVSVNLLNSAEFGDVCEEYGITQGTAVLPGGGSGNGGAGDDVGDTPEEMVKNFVKRLYSILLDREVDDTGLAYWSDILINQQDTGAAVASNIIFSEELINKNLSDEEYVTRLYKTVFNREPDSTGLNYWVGVLAQGEPRKRVGANMLNSAEFGDVCERYNIIQGTASVE